MQRFFWVLVVMLSCPGGCKEEKPVVEQTAVACGSPGLDAERCSVVGESCPCSGFECPTYHDGFCTAVCTERLVWALENCGRAKPPVIGSPGGAGGEAGAAGAAGAAL